MKIRLRDRILWGLFIGGEGAKAYLTGKLFLWTPPKYSRKKYRLLVARLVREGSVQQAIIEGKVNFRLTEIGKKQLLKSYPVLNPPVGEAGPQRIWDGFWRIVIFDIPEDKRLLRDKLRRYLLKLGFGELQNSTYVSAYDYQKEFLSWLKTNGLEKNVLLLESKQKYLGEPKLLAEKVWGLGKLNSGYKEIVDRLTTRFGIKDESRREEFLKKIYRDWLEVFLRDPGLPIELLGEDWQGEKAKKYVLRSGVVKE
ncbi:MAG: CRISPR-associated endonuclease Cas2 [Candidatus Beckwithbacteria bacterium]|nr:CRISPR-associated endonuclease Cas2 [Candidatus Beckwithbacteria bacterium]